MIQSDQKARYTARSKQAGRERDQRVQRKIFGRLTGPAFLRLRNIGALTTKAQAPASDGGIYAAAS